MIKAILGVAILSLIAGLVWQAKQFHADNFISKSQHDRVVENTVKTIEKKADETVENRKKKASEAERDLRSLNLDSSDAIDLLCQSAQSCREHKNR